jgi:hypothetical protein
VPSVKLPNGTRVHFDEKSGYKLPLEPMPPQPRQPLRFLRETFWDFPILVFGFFVIASFVSFMIWKDRPSDEDAGVAIASSVAFGLLAIVAGVFAYRALKKRAKSKKAVSNEA